MLSTRDLDCELNLSVDVPYDIIDPYLPKVRNRLDGCGGMLINHAYFKWSRPLSSDALQRQPKSNATNSEVFIVISQFFFPKTRGIRRKLD
jgi:hypothetical protein